MEGTDLLVLRELTGGLYFGRPRGRTTNKQGIRVKDTLTYTSGEMERIIRLGFDLARQRRKQLASVDKANVLASSGLWREIAVQVAEEYPDVTVEHLLVDACAMHLINEPRRFDVLVTENMFGDILSDEASVLAGSLGMLPSASLGRGRRGLYRARARHRARYCRPGQGEPLGGDPLRGHALAPFSRFGAGSGGSRKCRGSCAGGGIPHPGLGARRGR